MSHLSRLRSLVEFALILSAVPALQSTVWAQQLQQTVETPVQAVARAVAKYGAQWASGGVADWTAEGTVTMFGVDGPKATFNMTLMRKGSAQVQRIIKEPGVEIRQGSDGSRTWESFGGSFVPVAQGHALRFLESQTVRSIQQLLQNAPQLQLRDVALTSNEHVIEAQDTQGRKTRYSIDAFTSTITKLEFVTGQSTDPFSGRTVFNVETYLFSDYRVVNGLLTPFTIGRYIDGIKAEEMRFSSIRYNASPADSAFRP